MPIERPLNCDVPDCDQPMFCGWAFQELRKRVCLYHMRRNNNPKDKFSLLRAFGKGNLVGVKLDRFGFVVPRDAHLVKSITHNYAEERKRRSLERLKRWKDGLRPPPPKKLNERRNYDRVRRPEMDDIVADVLNGD